MEASANVPFDGYMLADRMEEGAERAPAEEDDDGTGAVDDGGQGEVDEYVQDVEDCDEDAHQAAEELHDFGKHVERFQIV